jgi:hypothetical protein
MGGDMEEFCPAFLQDSLTGRKKIEQSSLMIEKRMK